MKQWKTVGQYEDSKHTRRPLRQRPTAGFPTGLWHRWGEQQIQGRRGWRGRGVPCDLLTDRHKDFLFRKLQLFYR